MRRSISIILLLCLLCVTLGLSARASSTEVESAYEEFAPLSATFSQEEISNSEMWPYAVPDRTVTLSATPENTVFSRLQNQIQAAPAGLVTHIVIPFHINTGQFTASDATIVGVRPGATVVLIGDHPNAPDGRSVISDTHSGTIISRTFRLRGSGGALVLRNITLQKVAMPGTAQSTPINAPAPTAIDQQTGTGRGGGVAIENGGVAGVASTGGGHLILCAGAVIQNTSTDNNGPVDVQTNGRFTMMANSLMHTNAAGNSGGAVNVNTNATFEMHGGVIRNNTARGENVNSPLMRAVGGAILVQNGGAFIMHDGEIHHNNARLDEISAAPSATNAVVTSSGGAVFVTGRSPQRISSFTFNNGTIRDNSAIRTRSSGLATGTSAAAITARNNYRAGNGGAVYVTNGARFTMQGGTMHNNTATNQGNVINTATAVNGLNLSNGGGVYLTGSGTTFEMSGGTIKGNHAAGTIAADTSLSGNGGGIHAAVSAQIVMSGGEISDNAATDDGGGVFLTGAGTAARMTDGSIERNVADDGGGFFVPHANLSSVSIAQAFVFSHNVARNGMKIDSNLAARQTQISPGTVTISDWNIVDEIPAGSENFVQVSPHAFTNYDINAEGPRFWRVTYETGSNEGTVSARVGNNRFPVPNDSFLPDGTELSFNAELEQTFTGWEIGTRATETVDFDFIDGGKDLPLWQTISLHTHVIGNFDSPATTLTISKAIEGEFANRIQVFDFTVFFQGPDGNPLPAGTELDYTGDTIVNSGATAPADRTLILDDRGSAAFQLTHGQVIIVESVPQKGFVQVVEAEAASYRPSFIDSENPNDVIFADDTTMLAMTENRAFSFINEHLMTPPTGLDVGDTGKAMLLPVVALLVCHMGIVSAIDYPWRKPLNNCTL